MVYSADMLLRKSVHYVSQAHTSSVFLHHTLTFFDAANFYKVCYACPISVASRQ